MARSSSTIGRSLAEGRWRAVVAAAVGLAAAAAHLSGFSRSGTSLLAGGVIPGLVTR